MQNPTLLIEAPLPSGETCWVDIIPDPYHRRTTNGDTTPGWLLQVQVGSRIALTRTAPWPVESHDRRVHALAFPGVGSADAKVIYLSDAEAGCITEGINAWVKARSAGLLP